MCCQSLDSCPFAFQSKIDSAEAHLRHYNSHRKYLRTCSPKGRNVLAVCDTWRQLWITVAISTGCQAALASGLFWPCCYNLGYRKHISQAEVACRDSKRERESANTHNRQCDQRRWLHNCRWFCSIPKHRNLRNQCMRYNPLQRQSLHGRSLRTNRMSRRNRLSTGLGHSSPVFCCCACS